MGSVHVSYEYKKKHGYGEPDTLIVYTFGTSVATMKGTENGAADFYPLFYTFLDGHPILLTDPGRIDWLVGIDEKSKEDFDKWIAPYVITDKNDPYYRWIDVNRVAHLYYFRDFSGGKPKDVLSFF